MFESKKHFGKDNKEMLKTSTKEIVMKQTSWFISELEERMSVE